MRALLVAAFPEIGGFLLGLQLSVWAAEFCWPYIEAYFQPPKTLEELQADANDPQPGYDIHHKVEKKQAEREGYPKELWDGPANRLRIPTLKHWQITAWFMTPNEEFEWHSPRDYLKGKSWEEKMRVGREALILFGVLKP